MQSGRLDEARKTFDSMTGHGPQLSLSAALAARQGRTEDANRLLATMQSEMRDAGHFQYAEVFAQQGRIDEALQALEQAWRTRDPGLSFINVDVLLDPLRSDARFQNIVARLDFPPSV